VIGTDTCGTGAISSIDILTYPGSAVSITISVSADAICAYSPVVFTATPVNGGTTPSYQWKVNGINAGPNNSVFTCTPLNGDCIVCSITSSDACATGNPATSNQICMTVNQLNPVSLNITSTSAHTCAGTPVTFNGFPPILATVRISMESQRGQFRIEQPGIHLYSGQWRLHHLSTDLRYQLPDGDPALSNPICMTVDQPLPVSVTVTTPQTTVCAGTTVTFTANPTHGGSLPGYQWKVNGVSIPGATNSTYTYTPLNSDIVTCELASSDNCVTGNPALSPL